MVLGRHKRRAKRNVRSKGFEASFPPEAQVVETEKIKERFRLCVDCKDTGLSLGRTFVYQKG